MWTFKLETEKDGKVSWTIFQNDMFHSYGHAASYRQAMAMIMEDLAGMREAGWEDKP